ncbi:MAG: glycosyltransferase [Plesiomonas sp.]|uniref:glycosyltransferase n=1 Tax=Plesiomonas sp. TaxID=2486279 RepID=UPI003F35AAC3
MNADFSVLLSLYYKEKAIYLDECLASLSIQTLRSNDIVIVYDGHIPDELKKIVEKWKGILPIHIVVLDENLGLGRALNIGLNNCKFDVVLRMDTDDICKSARFEKQFFFMQENPDFAICGSCIEEIEPETKFPYGSRMVPEKNADIKKVLPVKNPFNHMTVAYRKSAVQKVGGYQHFHLMEDWYLWIRLLASDGKAYNFQECLVQARAGSDMISRRSGLEYIKSEWKMTKLKVAFKLVSMPKAIFIFFLRGFPRLMPKSLLGVAYFISRLFR